MVCQGLKFKKKTIISLMGIIVLASVGASVFVVGQKVVAKDGTSNFQIKDSYIEVQKTDYPQNIALVKKEKGKEEITGQIKIVDQYLISDIPENEFLDEYPNLKEGFQDLTLSLEADEPLFNKENFYYPPSLFEKTKSLFGFETLPEYRITKEVDKSASVQTALDLSKISLITHYQESGSWNLEYGVKQTLTLANNSEQDLNLSLLLKHQIGTDKIYWNNQEYSIAENPRKFVNPDKISFNTENGKSFYDFSDVPEEFEPELWIENKDGQNLLILSLNIFIPAGETKTIDPTYGVDTETGGYVKIEPSGTCERKGMVQVRLSMYLYPGDYGYEKHHVQVPVIPVGGYLGGYPGKVDGIGQPIDINDYNKWIDSLPKVWRDNPFHNHLIYVEPAMSDEEIMNIAETFLKEAYDKWSANKTLDLKNPAVAWPATVNSARLGAVEVKVQHLKTTPLVRQNTLGKEIK